MTAAYGLQRWKPRVGPELHTLPDPALAASWFGLEASDAVAPPAVADALVRLDALASRLELVANLEHRIAKYQATQIGLQWVPCALGRAAFGLDDPPDDSVRLRRAIWRAWCVAWRYADAFMDREQYARDAKRLAPAWTVALSQLTPSIVEFVDRDREASRDYREGITSALFTLSGAIAEAEALGNWKPAAAHRPDRFLILRLAEVYAVSFGRVPALHITPRRNSDEDYGGNAPPDANFHEFLEIVFACFSWPDRPKKSPRSMPAARSQRKVKAAGTEPDSTGDVRRLADARISDDTLKGIPASLPGYFVGRLKRIATAAGSPTGIVRYEELPSHGLLIDLNASLPGQL